ncbi:MAG: pilus (MSHA type) biogenesis protein MshL [Woeseiaceae bacterium]|nr:pilus (MSHA type) biogenesis protein MshL [Woeseiaceae bacterium]
MHKKLLIGLAAAALLAGCITPRGEATRVAIDDALQEGSLPPVAPDDVAQALLPDVGVDMPDAANDRFDVNTDATPARAFFMALVEGTPYNMVVHPQVSGRISLSMKSVTVEEVLDVVEDVYGYAYRRTPTGFVVMPATIQTRIFQIDYLNLRRAGISRTTVSSGQITGGQGGSGGARAAHGGGSSQSGQGSQGAARGGQQGAAGQVAGSGIETNYQADFWTELQETLEDIVGEQDGHQVVVNAQSGVVVVRAMPESLRRVQDYLETVQAIAQRQVIIEAKIIEVQLNDGYQAGVNWLAVAQNSSGDQFTLGQFTPPTGFGGDFDDLGGVPITLEPGIVPTTSATTTLGGAFAMAFDVGDFNGLIELLSAQGETRVLSSPRVSTLNNQKAVIKAGSDEFFVTNVTSSTVTGTASSTSREIELTRFFSGIALDVTPQIAADGSIILHIHPTVSEVTDQQKVVTVSGESDTLPLAFSEIREADSIVRAESGQIIVIGGLMRNTSRTDEFGMPILRHIPGIGRLFKSEREIESKTELVILLKPIVADSSNVWTKLADESLQRVRDMTR